MTNRYTAPALDLRDWLLTELTECHAGAANAITWADLAERARAAGFTVLRDERNLREEVNALQAEDRAGALIVGSNRPPYGIFVAQSMAEVDDSLAQLYSRIATMSERAKRTREAAEAAFRARAVQGQLF